MTTTEPYLKAAGSDRMARYYDLMARGGMRERKIKGRVIECAELAAGQRLLDVGCGTGTLVLMASERHPDATIIGVDGDPVILAIARSKVEKAGVPAQLDEAMAYALPYAGGSFDAVVSTLTFHHLTPDQQQRALAELRRVLRPGGHLVIADFSAPHNRLMRLAQHFGGKLMRRHGSAHGCQHAGSATHGGAVAHHDAPSHVGQHQLTPLEHLLRSGGWQRTAPTERFMSIFGTVAVYALRRPT